MKLFLDSSSLVKAFVIEEGSYVTEEILRLCLGKSEDVDLIIGISDWNISESIAALDQKCFQRRVITERERNRAIEKLYDTIGQLEQNYRLERFPVMLDLTDKDAIDKLIVTRHISADDALHLHTAKKAGYMYILSADKALVNAAKKEGVIAYNHNNQTDCAKLLADITKQQ